MLNTLNPRPRLLGTHTLDIGSVQERERLRESALKMLEGWWPERRDSRDAKIWALEAIYIKKEAINELSAVIESLEANDQPNSMNRRIRVLCDWRLSSTERKNAKPQKVTLFMTEPFVESTPLTDMKELVGKLAQSRLADNSYDSPLNRLRDDMFLLGESAESGRSTRLD